jgi:alanyl-tRNA synthetase
MTTDELRQLFLDFFIRKDHTLVPSDSLVPTYDPSLLFSGAGMNQFKDEFLGRGKRPLQRACSSQKCIRTGDIDSVGVTTSHHVFFEMLGNFSFGNYFKRDAILWSWEFYREVLKIPEEKLSVSIYEEDQEAYDIWAREVGLAENRIFRFDAHENFWPADAPSKAPAGQLCGPCSEIFFDLGPNDCTSPDCSPACDCRRHVEIWNLVFQQYQKGEQPGELHDLPRKNIDTGAGLERNAAVMQGVRSDFDLDVFKPLVNEAERLVGSSVKRDDEEKMKYLRRIADYMRAVTFLIADGVLPENEGRGYVEKRLLRRTVLAGRALGAEGSFCHKMVGPVVEIMGQQYPEIRERRDNIARIVKAEEEKFQRTLEAGGARMEELISQLKNSGQTVLPGAEAFRLYSTYGFPVELAADMLQAEGLALDQHGFDRAARGEAEQGRKGSKFEGVDVFGDVVGEIKAITAATEFVRDWSEDDRAEVKAIVRDGELVKDVGGGEEVELVLDRTPFYGESGGQVGDTGTLLVGGHKWAFTVTSTGRADEIFLHSGSLEDGALLRVGDQVRCELGAARRAAVEANHTATHILHHYLREVLGDHVEQSGSLVGPDRLRLDFTHFEAVNANDLRRVEELCNAAIRDGGAVNTIETGIAEAKAAGAMALFGEKYGEKVRMVTTDLGSGSKSVELCGGTHLDNLSSADILRIEREESVAAGIRRITATTARGARDNARADRDALAETDELLGLECQLSAENDPAGATARERLEQLCRALKAQRDVLVTRVRELVKRSGLDELALGKLPADEGARAAALLKSARQAEKKADGEAASELAARGKDIAAAARDLGGDVKFAAAALEDVNSKDLRRLADEVRSALPSGVVFLASNSGGKASLVATVSEDLIKKGIKAGDIVKAAAAKVGGGGGGRPNMAQAGGSNPENIPAAIAAAEEAATKSQR